MTAGESALLDRLRACLAQEEQVTLVLGSGVSANAVPRINGVLQIADQYAAGRSDDGGLRKALRQARDAIAEAPPADVYAAYRRVFGEWVSGDEFDVIAQQAVLRAYRPADRMASPLAVHGLWQRIGLSLGERLENDRDAWQLPPGVHAAGHLLARRPEDFGNQVLTTNFDPLLEIAIRSAGGRAVSIPLGGQDRPGDYAAVQVHHLHGFWRPTVHVLGPRLLHDPALVTGPAGPLAGDAAALITGDTVVVLGVGDRAGTVTAAIAGVAARRSQLRVLWAVHDADREAAGRLAGHLRAVTGARVDCFAGVDADRLLPALAASAGIVLPDRPPKPRHRHRHHNWERQLVSQPDANPPTDLRTLLLQLERRFAWRTLQASPAVTPNRLLWPVRVRTRASVIHMVQAFAAGALARAGVEILVCLDDYGAREPGVRTAFRADIGRWLAHVYPAAAPSFVPLSAFVEDTDRTARREEPEALLRLPTDPWAVARAFYGEHNPSLYNVLAAVRAVPNLTTMDELQRDAWPIVQALLSRDANRLLTPLTLWSFLHDMLLDGPADEVMTLGGLDEAYFWAQWQDTFGSAVGQLHNPFIRSLSHESQMLRWSTADELRRYLHQTRELPEWSIEGGYIPWLFQNALLLPRYLRQEPVLRLGGFALDSWAAFAAAIEDDLTDGAGRGPLDVLAEQVSELYLDEVVRSAEEGSRGAPPGV